MTLSDVVVEENQKRIRTLVEQNFRFHVNAEEIRWYFLLVQTTLRGFVIIGDLWFNNYLIFMGFHEIYQMSLMNRSYYLGQHVPEWKIITLRLVVVGLAKKIHHQAQLIPVA